MILRKAEGKVSGINKCFFVLSFMSQTHTPAHSQDRDLSEVTAALLLGFTGRQIPHQRPFFLAAASAGVRVAARGADGVQVAAGVLGCSCGGPR